VNYYNEKDPKAAAWLKQLIVDGLIPKGEVDERSIVEVKPTELVGFRQCHFFAGIGGWSHALRIAGVPDNYPLTTGSCPCQPFSCAGQQKGFADERHLWPVWFELIRGAKQLGLESFQCLLGEQVERAVGLGWLDGVFADLEGEGYTCGAAVLGASSAGAPNIRQRLYWMAYTEHTFGRTEHKVNGDPHGRNRFGGSSGAGNGLFHTNGHELRRIASAGEQPGCGEQRGTCQPGNCRHADGGEQANGVALGDTNSSRSQGQHLGGNGAGERIAGPPSVGSLETFRGGDGIGQGSGFWDQYDIVKFKDGKARRIEPGTFPLVNGFPCRVDLLRGYGNAINPYTAAIFIETALEATRKADSPLLAAE
jgi:DNA (cytosine-5)-methyltransferase 1